ncbi:pectate lyase [Paraphaeosphaeria sporulosa]
MKLSVFALSTSLLGASARPKASDYSLAGFAKDNPLGVTTGGAGGETITVTTPAALKAAIADTAPRTIYLTGNFTLTGRLSIGPNKSLIGTGPGANILANGFNIKSVSNVIIRNIGIRGITGNDGITIQNSTRVWIDHNEFESGGFPANGPDAYDGQCDIIRASDWITVSWNYFHDHWKSSLVGNSDALRDVDQGHLHVTYHHNYWRNEGTRGPAGRFGHQHVYNNLYEDYLFQAIHSRSDNQVLVEGNVFRGNTSEALSTYGLVIPNDSPNTSPDGDYELDGFANLGAKWREHDTNLIVENDWGPASINITRVGNFTKAPYKYTLTALGDVEKVVKAGAGLGKI